MKKILIVEDDRELKEGICYALQKAGYLTESADSVQNAKTLFLKEGADVILLDVNLPDGEGFDFCKWVKERTPVPVLFLTARDLEEDALCGYEAGAEDYVTKPFSMKILLKKIDVLCRNGSRQEHRCFEDGFLRVDFDAGKSVGRWKRMCSDTDRISDASLFYGKCRSSFDIFRIVRKTVGFHGRLCGQAYFSGQCQPAA